MRFLLFSLGLGGLAVTTAWAQNTGTGGGVQQLPVGQTFKQFEFPVYQDGKLKATLNAALATGITLNRAETTDLKIEVYDEGTVATTGTATVTTTVTSPKADLYVEEQKMRTKNTVQIERSDMEATSQSCDFDLKTKKYLLRDHVRVVLKHLDVGSGAAPGAPHAPPANATPATTPPDGPIVVTPTPSSGSILESPGSASPTPAPSP